MDEKLTQFRKLIKEQSWSILQEKLLSLDNPSIVFLIEHSREFDSAVLFRFLPREKAKDVFQ